MRPAGAVASTWGPLPLDRREKVSPRFPAPGAPAAEYMASIDPDATEAEFAFKSADGRRSVIAINIVKPESKPFTRMQLKMLSVLGKSPVPLTRKELAKLTQPAAVAAGRDPVDLTRGRWGKDLGELLSSGVVFEDDGKVTDAVSKLEK